MRQPLSAGEKGSNRKGGFFHTKLGLTLLVLLGSAMLIGSFYLPYWDMTLHAPQYPQGLRLAVYLDHVSGDVSEIDLLNHYIGMEEIEKPAQFERRHAWLALILLSCGALIVLPVGRKIYKVFYFPPLLFLGGFMGDLFLQMYRAGHILNPDAPVHIKPFTPILFGEGHIGQFHTIAFFGSGFWVATAATAIFFVAIGRRKPLCQGCEHFETCSVVCNRPGSWFRKT